MRGYNGNGNGNGHNGNGNGHPAAVAEIARVDRQMPQNVEAEQALIGAILIDNGVIEELGGRVAASDFYRAQHSFIFHAMQRLHDRQEPIDYVTVVEELARLKQDVAKDRRAPLEWVDTGIDYLADLAERVPTAANAAFYAHQVRTRGVLREVIGTTVDINRDAFDFHGDLDDFLDGIVAKFDAIVRRREEAGRETITVRTALQQVFAELDEHQARDGCLTGLPTGILDLDELTGGLQNGEMIVIGARPSMGKTTLALSLMRWLGIREGLPLAFFSCEMGRKPITHNMLCAEARLNTRRLRTGQLDEFEFGRLVAAAGKMADAPIFIDDTPNIRLRELKSKARRLWRQHGIRALFVDYLQLVQAPKEHGKSREQEVAECSRELKGLARELDIPVVVLAQLNRDVEKRSGTHRPRMSDLRESGSLEQDADVIALLHREHYYTRNEEDLDKAELIIAKQRNGPTGTARLRYRPEFMRFEDPEDGGGAGAGATMFMPGTAGDPELVKPPALPKPVAAARKDENPDRNFEPDRDDESPFDYAGNDLPPTI